MRPLGTVRPWPPDPMDELRRLFAGARSRATAADTTPSLHEMCGELDAWLADERDYSGRYPRIKEWRSLISDFTATLDTRGPRLRQRSSGLDAIQTALTPRTGSAAAQRLQFRGQLRQAQADLAVSDAAVDALDDLWEALEDPHSSAKLVLERVDALRSVFALARRSLATSASTLAGVADDSAFEVALARQSLDGVEIPEEVAGPGSELADSAAGLTTPERLQLLRRLVAQPAPQGRHVVWVFYGNARFEPWVFELGPVTFLDGPTLLSVFDQIDAADADDSAATGSSQGAWRAAVWAQQLPAELLEEERARFVRARHRWPKLERWVAARVDLGDGPHLDPVAEARRQADALVGLARFHHGIGSWIALTGHTHFISGAERGASWPIDVPQPSPDEWPESDRTDTWLVESARELQFDLPVHDRDLTELVECIGVLNDANWAAGRQRESGLVGTAGPAGPGIVTGAVTGPVVFLQRVRVLDLLASRVRVAGLAWDEFMTDFLRDAWVREELLARTFSAAERVAADSDLAGHDPSLSELYGRLVTPGPDLRVTTHRDVALHALPGLAAQLPGHFQAARVVRAVAASVADVSSLRAWVEELRAQYQRNVERASRCRNSLTHGGPVNAASVASVNPFLAWEAGLATVVALRGVLAGSSVRDALENKREELRIWADRLETATTVAEALVPPSGEAQEASS